MRIDAFNSSANEVSSELSSQQVGAQNPAQVGQAGSEDRTTLSSDTTSLSSLVSAAMNTPELRQGTIDSLRQAVNNGQYELDPAKIAAAMIDDQA
jgi:flagellar biosynthesis anti-sigma factor FlgM